MIELIKWTGQNTMQITGWWKVIEYSIPLLASLLILAHPPSTSDGEIQNLFLGGFETGDLTTFWG